MSTVAEALALANQFHRAGKPDQAEQMCRWILQQDPNHAEALHTLGLLALQSGNHGLAIAYLTRAVAKGPRSAVYCNNLAVAFACLGKFAEAETAYRQSLQRNPGYAEAHNGLGFVLRNLGRLDEALACFAQAVRCKPDYADAYNNWGLALQEHRRHEEAAVCYEQALRLRPEYGDARSNLGTALEQLGKLTEALACYREDLRRRPNCVLAYLHLARFAAEGLCPFTARDLEQGEALLAGQPLRPTDASLVHFALAGVLDHQGRHDEAFAHYRTGNDLMKRQRELSGEVFRADRHRDWIDQVIATFDRAYFRRVGSLGDESERPVFVVGMPRSGTTLLTQILSSHPLVHGAGELPDVPRLIPLLEGRLGGSPYPACTAAVDAATVKELAGRHLQQLATIDAQALRVVDKLPINFLHLGLIATLFPRARILHCIRNPLDVCLSCYCQNFQHIDFARSFEDLAAYHREYERLMAHWREVLPMGMLEVRYEGLVANQEAVSREMIAWCGLEWNPRCLTFHENRRVVQTASTLQVRRPLYARSVGRWKNYRTHLGPLIQALGLATGGEKAGWQGGASPLVGAGVGDGGNA